MSKLGRSSEDKVQCWEPLFVFYFCFTIKYFIPCVLWVLLCQNTKNDLDNPYGGYDKNWQYIGLAVPGLGLLAFIFNLCCCLHDEPLNNEEHVQRFDKEFFDPWEQWKKGLKKMDEDLENMPSENFEVEMY